MWEFIDPKADSWATEKLVNHILFQVDMRFANVVDLSKRSDELMERLPTTEPRPGPILTEAECLTVLLLLLPDALKGKGEVPPNEWREIYWACQDLRVKFQIPLHIWPEEGSLKKRVPLNNLILLAPLKVMYPYENFDDHIKENWAGFPESRRETIIAEFAKLGVPCPY